jgi:hypothetical protein
VRRPPFFHVSLPLTDSFRLAGIGTDYEAIARITNQRLEHCEKVRFPRPLSSSSAVDTLLPLTAESGSRLRSHLVLGRCVTALAVVERARCREAIPASSSFFSRDLGSDGRRRSGSQARRSCPARRGTSRRGVEERCPIFIFLLYLPIPSPSSSPSSPLPEDTHAHRPHEEEKDGGGDLARLCSRQRAMHELARGKKKTATRKGQ